MAVAAALFVIDRVFPVPRWYIQSAQRQVVLLMKIKHGPATFLGGAEIPGKIAGIHTRCLQRWYRQISEQVRRRSSSALRVTGNRLWRSRRISANSGLLSHKRLERQPKCWASRRHHRSLLPRYDPRAESFPDSDVLPLLAWICLRKAFHAVSKAGTYGQKNRSTVIIYAYCESCHIS